MPAAKPPQTTLTPCFSPHVVMSLTPASPVSSPLLTLTEWTQAIVALHSRPERAVRMRPREASGAGEIRGLPFDSGVVGWC
jgi:hypothetical protein